MNLTEMFSIFNQFPEYAWYAIIPFSTAVLWTMTRYFKEFNFSMNKTKLNSLNQIKSELNRPKENRLVIEQTFRYCFGYLPQSFEVVEYILNSSNPSKLINFHKSCHSLVELNNKGFTYKEGVDAHKRHMTHVALYIGAIALTFLFSMNAIRIGTANPTALVILVIATLYSGYITWVFLESAWRYKNAIHLVDTAALEAPKRQEKIYMYDKEGHAVQGYKATV